MEVLNEWIRLTMGIPDVLKFTFGDGLDLTKLPSEIRNHLEVFCFGVNYLTEKDLEYIDAQWDSLADLNYIYRLYKTFFIDGNANIKPIVSLWQDIKSPIYVGINKDSRIYLTYILLPLPKTKNSVFLETLNRNFQTTLDEIKDLPVIMGMKQSTSPSKQALYIVNDPYISDDVVRKNRGIYIGDCLIFEKELLVVIGNNITYWDRLNKTITFQKDNVKAVAELLCKGSIAQSKIVPYDVFLRNI